MGAIQEAKLASFHPQGNKNKLWMCGEEVDSGVTSGQVVEGDDDSAGRTEGGISNRRRQPTNSVTQCLPVTL